MHKKKYSSTKGKLFQTSLAALFRNDCTTDFVGKRSTTDLIDLDIRFHIIGLEEDTKIILLRSNLMMGRQRKFCLLVFKKDQFKLLVFWRMATKMFRNLIYFA